MTLEEAIEQVELEPEYIQAIYNNGFKIDTYSKITKDEYLNGEFLYGEYEEVNYLFKIVIPVAFLRNEYKLIIEWDDFDGTFFEAVLYATGAFKIAGEIQKYIASDENMELEYMKNAIDEGYELYNTFRKLENDVKEVRDELFKKECEEARRAQREERLSKMTPEERKHAELEEKVFDELSETLIFQTKLEKASVWGIDSPLQKEFEDWVVEEVNYRVSRIEEEEETNK